MADALTAVLRTVRLQGSIFFGAEAQGAWGMAFPQSSPELGVAFHTVRRGRCVARVHGATKRELELEAGDLVLFPRGTPHDLVDTTTTSAEPIAELVARHGSRPRNEPMRLGAGGPTTTLLCGYFVTRAPERDAHPLLSVLPDLVLVRGTGGRASAWLESLLALIDEETRAALPGSETVVDRLTEALFIRIVRAWLSEESERAPSWIAALSDVSLARVLGLIHGSPAHPWTVDELARRAGVSRSGLAAHFREKVGEPPMHYLARWRMQLAAHQLEDPDVALVEVAERVGYHAEEAFSRAFKRFWSEAPGAWRRRHARRAARGEHTAMQPFPAAAQPASLRSPPS
ncbi:MAG: AraC family transcriptional regulator [Deltaproteobacteria bacterium]|nr:AraC family transcriptional regulator [Deltaproteobacteria bacterium]